MKLTKQQKNAIIYVLHEYAHGQDIELGLPIESDDSMAKMREFIDEILEAIA